MFWNSARRRMRSRALNPDILRGLFAADRELFPALGAPPFEHQPPVLGAHSNQKPVSPLPASRVWLKRSLTLHASPRKTSMLAKGFRRCQRSQGFCVRVAIFASRKKPPRRHGRLVSPQSFPHLWKKLWKLAGCRRQVPQIWDFGLKMNLWDQVLARIETKVNRHSFYTWFKPTSFIGEDGAAVTVRVPNQVFKDWLTKHYSGVIGEAMAEVAKASLAVNFVSESPAETAVIAFGADEAAVFEAQPPATTTPGPAGLNPRYTFDTFI